jgi:anti-sigma factor RsiW
VKERWIAVMDSEQEKQMAQYLLGQLPEQEEAELERRYLADDTQFEELLAVEDDLRDAYARGELAGPDREAFEQRLLTLPQQRQKQEFARTFRQYLLQAGNPARPQTDRASKWEQLLRVLAARPQILVPALTTALVILIVGGWWVERRSARPPTTGALRGQAPEAQAAKRPPMQPPEAKTLAVVLTPGLARGGEESRLVVIPSDVGRVRFEARFEGDYPRYHAMLATVEGRQIWSGEGNLEAQAFPGGERIFLDLSSNMLPPGDYILTVRGLSVSGSAETVAEYTFRVENR